jgi:hypothetical protein
MWPDLGEAKKNSINISREIEKMLREQNSLMKKDIAAHKEKLLEETDEAISKVDEEYKALVRNLKNHRKTVESKANFLKRHNRINFK